MAQGVNILAAMLDISWLFMGLEQFKRTVTKNTLVKLVSLASIFIFVKTINAKLKTQLKNNFSLCNIFIIPLQNIYETITKLTRNKNFDNIKN